MGVRLPDITHLQFMALEILRSQARWLAGELLRDHMRGHGAGHRSLPAWYQFFGRLEEHGLIKARRSGAYADYRLLKKGERALAASRRFYCDDECSA